MSIHDEVHEELKGYLIGAQEEFTTTQLRELLDEMLWSRSPTAIKSRTLGGVSMSPSPARS